MTEKQIEKLKVDIKKYLLFVAMENAECADLDYLGISYMGKRSAYAEIARSYLSEKTFIADCIYDITDGKADFREEVRKES
jgi:hypothetical protein